METWRRIVDWDGAPGFHMALDEALLAPETPPTLRFYQWEQATLSLGYFQPFEEMRSLPPELRAMPVVRRLTGGGAIVHERELTYSLVLPKGHRLLAGGSTGGSVGGGVSITSETFTVRFEVSGARLASRTSTTRLKTGVVSKSRAEGSATTRAPEGSRLKAPRALPERIA